MSEPAPHAAAESDPRDPSRAANQTRSEPVLTSPAHDLTPSTKPGQADAAGGSELRHSEIAGVADSAQSRPGGDQGDVGDERAVTDIAAAPGTSESMVPVQGVHTPDAGPGGAQFDTDQPGVPGRTTGSR